MENRHQPELPHAQRRIHRTLIDAMLATGGVPGVEDMAVTLGTSPVDVRSGLQMLVEADYLALDASGRVICLYPFSVVPTPHVVVVDERRRYAMCALDALGVAAMLGRAITVDGRCAACGVLMRLRVRPGAVVSASPAETVVVARRAFEAPASEVCCPFTVFACGEHHAEEMVARVPESEMLSLTESLGLAEAIFGDLLGDTLPAKRRSSADVEAAQRSTSTS
ncbi:MAG: organomercurial lyase [Thermomicrobiales bacterium]